jgi:D-alanyl-D-alanine endopeptidase (penicillin-binding protein 7)
MVAAGLLFLTAAPPGMAATASHARSSHSASGHTAKKASGPDIRSNMALVMDQALGETIYAKKPEQVAPIASITKLMTAMVVLDAQVPLDEAVTIDKADVDHMKNTHSRLPVGAVLARGEVMRVALMSSDNRAAAALARTYPGGTAACVEAMNRKAGALGMPRTSFADPTGLSSRNVSSAEDLTRMVLAASKYDAITTATTTSEHQVTLQNGRVLDYHNSNGLVSNRTWSIGLSKTGYINEAGRCLVMLAQIAARQVVIVLLDSWGKNTRLGDANRIRHWMESTLPLPPIPPPDSTASSLPEATSSIRN